MAQGCINDFSTAEEGLLDDTAQYFTGIRCDLVAVIQRGGGDGELGGGVPDDEVCVTADSNRSFSRLKPNLPRRIRTEPARQIKQREPTTARLRPHHRQPEL